MKLNIYRTLISTLAIVFLILGCAGPKEAEFKGFDRALMDTTVAPQDDFYRYAIGGWLRDNPIPADQVRWAAFTVLREQTREQVQKIIDDAANDKSASEGTLKNKIGTFYNFGMDSVTIEKASWSPLIPEMERIDAIATKEDLVKEIAHMHKYTAAPLFFFYSSVDAKNSEQVIAGMWQGGLGLPDRDYYIKDDGRSKEIREKYDVHLKNIFNLVGSDNELAEQQAGQVMAIETRLAKASNTRLENRNPEATYNKLSTSEIAKMLGEFDVMLYLDELEAGDPGHINVNQPKFISEVGKMFNDVPLDDWKTYLKWNLVRSMAPYLSSDFVDERFDFNGKFLSGQEVIQPRWKRVLNATSGALGEAVGQLYVEKYFPPKAKERAKKIVESLIVSMGESIRGLDWMSDETKEQALVKLDGFGVKIGYPDKWRDYSELEVSDSYVRNIMNANYFDHKETISEINQPVKEWEWGMTPQTVNAYYSPTRNEIVFPAAILQFPFYDVRVDDAINYGAMGAVIGHEISHGFDDQGRQYDADGNIRDWWTEEDGEKFDERAKQLVEQFNNFKVLDSLHVDGALTLGENIGDLGGLTVAYNAFTKTEQYKKGEKIDGFTPSQRFFLSWAQVWKNNIRDEELMRRLKTDVHSPGEFRVLGPLANMPEFFAAFDIPEGSAMRQDNPVKIW